MPQMPQTPQLHKHQLQVYNRLVFAAVAEREQFQNVNTITLKGEFAKKVEAAAIERVLMRNKSLTPDNISLEMSRVFERNNIRVQEAVHYDENGISAVVNAPAVDDEAISRAVLLVQQALDQLDGRYGTVTFGQPVSFTQSEINWLTHH